MKGYRFITSDDTSEFCHRVTEALSNGWKLYGEPKMVFEKKRDDLQEAIAAIEAIDIGLPIEFVNFRD